MASISPSLTWIIIYLTLTDKETNKIDIGISSKYISKLLKCVIKMLFQMAQQKSLILAIEKYIEYSG